MPCLAAPKIAFSLPVGIGIPTFQISTPPLSANLCCAIAISSFTVHAPWPAALVSADVAILVAEVIDTLNDALDQISVDCPLE